MVGIVFFCGDGEDCVQFTKPASFQRDLELRLKVRHFIFFPSGLDLQEAFERT
jgi:hypothetical protein